MRHSTTLHSRWAGVFAATLGVACAAPGPELAVRYTGDRVPDPHYYHGAIPPAVGVHHYQAFRANRTQAPEGGQTGWTYNHAPMLAYWQGRFWLEYLSDPVGESEAPGRTLLLSSPNGRDWVNPAVAFPQVPLPELKPPARYFSGRDLPVMPSGTETIAHQRMGWYVAPSGRLLMLSFYGYSPTIRYGPNRGQGLGRVVRSVEADGTLGPIYFVRYNREAGWDESNTPYPFYTQSRDAGFVSDCKALLADKLVTAQWWEEDRQKDGFFTIPTGGAEEPKAMSFYTRPDGVTVALWKNGVAALSNDRGLTWTLARHELPEASAKVWGQRTEDGRYALVYDHSATRRNRFPLVVITGDDGKAFGTMFLVHGEVPPMRYRGINRSIGPQYIRGIIPGNGNPPGGRMWLTYSVNKEDIWVTSVRTPITGKVDEPVNDTFDKAATLDDLDLWNLYSLKWAPVSLVDDPWRPGNRCLQLRDEDPYDYPLAERVFPAGRRVNLAFDLLQEDVGLNGLEVEAQTIEGVPALRLWFTRTEIGFDIGGTEEARAPFDSGRWHRLELGIDCENGHYELAVDGKVAMPRIELDGRPESVARIVFRTGAPREYVRQDYLKGEPSAPGVVDADLPGADEKTAASTYLIDNLTSLTRD